MASGFIMPSNNYYDSRLYKTQHNKNNYFQITTQLSVELRTTSDKDEVASVSASASLDRSNVISSTTRTGSNTNSSQSNTNNNSDNNNGGALSSIIPISRSKTRRDANNNEKINSDDNDDDDDDVNDSNFEFPNFKREMQMELLCFQYALIEHGFSATDCQEIVQYILRKCNGHMKLFLGMIDYGRLLLEVLYFQDNTVVSYDGGNNMHTTTVDPNGILVSKQILKASMVHYVQFVLGKEEEKSDDNDTNTEKQIISRIARGASIIEQAEKLTHSILGFQRRKTPITKKEAKMMRSLIISTMEDWRSLIIRCVACLFRLEMIHKNFRFHNSNNNNSSQQQQQQTTTKLYNNQQPHSMGMRIINNNKSMNAEQQFEMVQASREALLVYAPLAQRLGMYRLKARIEDKAFEILYKRQHKAVSIVYQQCGDDMQSIRSYLSSQVTEMLETDEALMSQLDAIEITARVKEPFSFWKKLMKKRLNDRKSKKNSSIVHRSNEKRESSTLSINEVQDGIALRVIIKANQFSPLETDETIQARERMLCYYIQHRLMTYWPALPYRTKDYIRHPKPNGYQSLQYTALIEYLGQQFPFEVQVRSEEMHQVAEFGVAAHWNYKLQQSRRLLTSSVNTAKKYLGSKDSALSSPLQARKTTTDGKGYAANENKVTGERFQMENDDHIDSEKGASSSSTTTAVMVKESSELVLPIKKKETSITGGLSLQSQQSSSSVANSYIDALVLDRQWWAQQQVHVLIIGGVISVDTTTSSSQQQQNTLPFEEGQIITLPVGSRIKDCYRQIVETDTTLSTCSYQIWNNGNVAHFDEFIRNGDVLLLQKIV